MRLSAHDVETDPEPAAEPPASHSWHVQITLALVGLIAGLIAVIVLMA